MENRTIKIVFKDNTSPTFKDKDVWLNDIVDEIKHAIALELPYILSSQDNDNGNNALINPTENIKYIRIIDKTDNEEKEHKNEN